MHPICRLYVVTRRPVSNSYASRRTFLTGETNLRTHRECRQARGGSKSAASLLAKASASARRALRRPFKTCHSRDRGAPLQTRHRALPPAVIQGFGSIRHQSRRSGGYTPMMRSAAHSETSGGPVRGICLVVKNSEPAPKPQASPSSSGVVAFPRRPDASVLSESIPLFFIGRNRVGFWIAREAEGRTGGIFLFKASAIHFAQKNGASSGCATMFVAAGLELDLKNRGNLLVALLERVLRRAVALIPDHPPPVLIRRGIFKGNHQ